MPRTGKRSKTSLSRSQKMEVRKIAEAVVDEEIEDKSSVATSENVQLFHNKALYEGKLMESNSTRCPRWGPVRNRNWINYYKSR